MKPSFSIGVLCNSRETLARNLLASPMLADPDIELHLAHDPGSAAEAYNRILEESAAPHVLLVHQDVYLPPGWRQRLERAIAQLDASDPGWAVFGAIGMSAEGNLVGEVWSTGIGKLIGTALERPCPVQSLDELLLVLRREAGLRFDPALDGFHMYGTDIVQSALAAGAGAYACALPLVHNHRFRTRLDESFSRAYAFIRRKWRARLPIRTTVLEVSAVAPSLALYRLRERLSVERRRAQDSDCRTDPRVFSARCGWE